MIAGRENSTGRPHYDIRLKITLVGGSDEVVALFVTMDPNTRSDRQFVVNGNCPSSILHIDHLWDVEFANNQRAKSQDRSH